MSVELNHTIIPARDKWVSAKFLADILNLEAGPEWGHFAPIRTANGVTLDFADREDFRPQHYAFLVSEAEFDAALARIRAGGVRHYASPSRAAGRDQPPLWRPRRLFRRPERASDGADHTTLRRDAPAGMSRQAA
jgi:hypothetical protein